MLAFFHKLIDVLNELEIPYMLSGSVGSVCFTKSNKRF